MKKISIFIILLLLLLPPTFLAAQSLDYPLTSIQRIQQIVEELKQIDQEKQIYYYSLENTNNERKKEIEERLKELAEKENELKGLKQTLTLFGQLIDENSLYTKKLQRSVTFWQITSGVLAVSTVTLIIIVVASK